MTGPDDSHDEGIMTQDTQRNHFGLGFTALRQVAAITRRLPPALTIGLLRALVPPGSKRAAFDVVTEMRGGLLLCTGSDSLVEWEVFFYGAHEAYILRLLERLTQPGHVVIDVGANVGTHSLPLSRRVGPEGLIVAVEPEPRVRERLLENIALNRLENVNVLGRAITAKAGARELFTYAPGSPNRMTSSFTPDAARPSTSVLCATLDETVAELGLKRLDLVKIDVEGYEPDVLIGGAECIARLRPHLVFECVDEHWRKAGFEFESTRGFLAGLGYDIFVIGNGWCSRIEDGRPAWSNLLAVPA